VRVLSRKPRLTKDHRDREEGEAEEEEGEAASSSTSRLKNARNMTRNHSG
jgi:hypothetical protein